MQAQTDFEKLKGDKKIPVKVMLKRIFKYVKPELGNFIIAFALLVLNVLLDIVLPMILGEITNILKLDNIDLKYVLIMAGAYFAIGAVNMVFIYFESMLLQRIGQRIIYKLRVEVFTHIENMSLNQFKFSPI